jgi:hypothetical protein
VHCAPARHAARAIGERRGLPSMVNDVEEIRMVAAKGWLTVHRSMLIAGRSSSLSAAQPAPPPAGHPDERLAAT